MSPEFRQKIDVAIASLRQFVTGAGPVVPGARLVQYAGVEVQGAIDVSAGEIEREVSGLISEGFAVEWAAHEQRLYLRVYESGDTVPGWEEVFAERNLADVTSILREASRDNAA